ncbi:unnamed protein product [Mytilus coruscus]|uniref:Fibronectin type-III domain-containing protein n=1 Tax=Mytilus coruscus TaxID=42192 RepID=A0A6J7ZUG4_MYTCO|nr:unnamed protein product [Mytilus coruscus]
MADSVVCRDRRRRLSRNIQESREPECKERIEIDHNYGVGHLCTAGATICAFRCPGIDKLLGSSKINTSTSWHSGRRLVEWETLLDHLQFCSMCFHGPLILSHQTIKGEMKCGLGRYLYVQCTSCQELNRIPYGSTHKENPSSKGMRSFSVNTKLGAAMIDALGGLQRVNTVLSTLNLPPISHKNVKVMERRAGEVIEGFANLSMDQRCREVFEAEMRVVFHGYINESVPAVNFSGMTVCADHGWQKRGFDSLTDIQKTWTFSWKFYSSLQFKERQRKRKRQIKSKLPEHKLRRLKLKEEKLPPKEPVRQQKEPAMNLVKISLSDQAEDIERIPDAIPKPLYTSVPSLDNPTFVVIDLETTDLIRRNNTRHIVQIAVRGHKSQTSFNRYIPTQLPMSNEPEKEQYNTHNAVNDVNMLDKILIAANVTSEQLLKQCYHSNSHLLQENFIKAKAKNLPSFHPLIASGVMKMTTAENIAGSGLNCAHLKLIYVRKGEEGFIDVLMSKNACEKKVDAASTSNIECIFPLTCSSGSCQCSKNQYWTRLYCAERKSVGINCKDANECLSPMTCKDGICKCAINQYWTGLTCAAQTNVNAACTADSQCISLMACSSGICQCSSNQYWTGSNCIAKKNVNAACAADSQCISPMACSSGRCQCSSNQFWTRSNCIARKGVGETCYTDNECLSPMTCADGACKCPTNQYWTGSSCTAQKNVNAACTADRDCISPLACSSGRCLCSSNQYWTGSNCIARKSVGVTCNTDNECLSPMTCADGACKCPTNQYWTGSSCTAQKNVNAACTVDSECISPMACLHGRCQCSSNQYWTGSNCIAKKNVNVACTADSECISPTTCSSGICQCSTNQYWTGSNCIAQKGLNAVCTADSECISSMICSSGSCQCSTNQYWTGSSCVACFGTQNAHFLGLEANVNFTFSIVAATAVKGSSEQSDMSVVVTTKQDRAKQTPKESQIVDQYEEIGMGNASFYQELSLKDNSNMYDQIGTMHTVDKQYENICLVCLLCITCDSTVSDISCTFDNVDHCTKYGNAKCDTNNCRCMNNYYDDGSTCQKKNSHGAACGIDDECLGLMTCINETCQCGTNRYWTGSKCATNKRRNALPCQVRNVCHNPEPSCDCSIRQYCSGSYCYQRKSRGQTCSSGIECLDPFSCTGGICQCASLQYWTGSTCVAKKSIDSNCNAGNECLSPMTCKGGTCQCAMNQYWTGYTCSAEKGVNETCIDNKECANTLNCSSGRCQCSTNQYWTGSACTAQKSDSINCNDDNECLRPMTCAGGTCECFINQRWTGLTCAALSSVPSSVTLSAASRSIQITWSKPVDSKSTIIGYRLRVLVNSGCVVEVLLVCSTGCTNVLIQHVCSADKRQIRENRRNTELMEPISYEIHQLLPYTDYNVWLNAINDAGNGNRSESLVTTDSEVPKMPLDVAASVESSSEIKVTWNLPGPKPGITTYHIKVYEMVLNAQPELIKGKNVTGFDKQIVQFSGLEAYWNYTFTVVAMTDKGSSEQSDMSSVVTTYQDAPGKVTNFEIKRPSAILTTMEVSWAVPLLRERNGIIKEYKINHNISGTTTTETIAAKSEIFQKLYYIIPDRHYQIEIYAVNSLNQAGEKLLKIYYASSKIESQLQESPKGYTIETVVGAAVGCVIVGGLIVGLVFCLIRGRRRHINSKQSKANHTQEESKIGGQYEEVGINNISANIELGTTDDKNVYDQIDRMPTVDKQYENMMCK